MKNSTVEIKARCTSEKINDILNLLISRNAFLKGIDRQTDTYFKVNSGRLKLREGIIENKLIFYDRENVANPKQSNNILFDVENCPDKSLSPLKDILLKSLGELVTVKKTRFILFVDNVKFHLDRVENLGTFAEIEAVDKDGNIGKEKLLEQCNYYLEMFDIKKEDLLSESYSDMLLNEMSLNEMSLNEMSLNEMSLNEMKETK